MLAATALVLPTSLPLTLTTPSRTSAIKALTYQHEGSLPDMYRARWMHDAPVQSHTAVRSHAVKDADTRTQVASIFGAAIGVGMISSLGAWKSASLTPLSLLALEATWPSGGAYDISVYTDMITDGVAASNKVFLPALGVAADVVVLTSVVALLGLWMEEMLSDAPSTSSDELCVLPSAAEPVCGPASFDSSEGYSCVELWENGSFRWVCA